jgi:Holliday junction resolvase RusA-like endonuclease
MISFVVHLVPRPKGRPRFWNGRVLTDKSTRQWEREFSRLASTHRPQTPLAGALKIKLLFQMPRPKTVKREHPCIRPDLDNFTKAAMDGLSAFWRDDCQIVQLTATKRYGEIGFVSVEIDEL